MCDNCGADSQLIPLVYKVQSKGFHNRWYNYRPLDLKWNVHLNNDEDMQSQSVSSHNKLFVVNFYVLFIIFHFCVRNNLNLNELAKVFCGIKF